MVSLGRDPVFDHHDVRVGAAGLFRVVAAGCGHDTDARTPGNPNQISIRFRLQQQSMRFWELLQIQDAIVQIKADRVLQERGQQVFYQLTRYVPSLGSLCFLFSILL
jgi:hypothetical protein